VGLSQILLQKGSDGLEGKVADVMQAQSQVHLTPNDNVAILALSHYRDIGLYLELTWRCDGFQKIIPPMWHLGIVNVLS
jgi:hypothetical protein